jgi:hypothetical protein
MRPNLKKRTTTEFTKPFSRASSMINEFAKAGIRATEGTLRLEVLLGQSGQYTFNVNAQQSALASETRLRQGDAIIPVSQALFVKELTSATPTDDLQCTAPLNTWNSGNLTSTNRANVYSMWSTGKLQYQVNSVNVTETLDCLRYYRAGVAQVGLTTVTSGASYTGAYGANQWDSADYGFQTLHQNICLNGQQNNTINLTLGSAVNMGGGTGNRYAVLMIRGILLINGANMVQDSSINAFLR